MWVELEGKLKIRFYSTAATKPGDKGIIIENLVTLHM